MSWGIWIYSYSIPMLLDEFLEWDRYYQMSKMLGEYEEYVFETPEKCFENTIKLLTYDCNGNKADEEGRYKKNILDIDKSSPIGFYYGR